MNLLTIGSKTIIQPTVVDVYGQSQLTKLIPIDGSVIIQKSNNRDSYGDKNADKRLVWDSLPTSGTDWTHTVGTLKALEGTDTTISGSNWGSAFSASASVRVGEVGVEWIGWNGTYDVYRVELNFTLR